MKEQKANSSSQRSPAVFYFAIAVLILVVITTNCTGGLFARYASYGEATDSARVIKFGDVTLVQDFGKNTIIPGVDIAKSAKISFTGSESATYLFIELDMGSKWSLTTAESVNTFNVFDSSVALMSWVVDGAWTLLSDTAGKYVFYKSLAPNDTLDSVNIIKDEKITVSEKMTKAQLATITADNSEHLSISINATVVQSIGFDSVSAAWNSVSGT